MQNTQYKSPYTHWFACQIQKERKSFFFLNKWHTKRKPRAKKKKNLYILYQLLHIIQKKRGKKERNHRSTLSQEESDKMSTKKI